MRRLFVAAAGAVLGAWFVTPAVAGEGLGPDAIFSRAKSVWRERQDAPFVQYALRERYTWRNRVHDNWWQASFRENDRAIALHRQIVEEQEEARLRGTPITLHLKVHNGYARADSLETNSDADAFPILDPQIEPDASFGLSRTDPKMALVGKLDLSATSAPGATATPAPTATPLASRNPSPDTSLRVLVTVEAASRDYHIDLVGTETLRDRESYHLTLTPLRDPHVYRLRDLWVDTTTFETLQIAVAGLFDGEPYRSARWIVTYVDVDGHSYIQQIRTGDQLRFGADRFVSGLQFDFVQYSFPPSLPDVTFARYL